MSAGPFTFLVTLSTVSNTGAPRMAVYFAKALRARGHSVHLAHGGDDQELDESLIVPDMREAGVTCTHVPGLARPIDPRLPARVAALAGPGCKAVIGFTQRDRCIALLAARKLSARGVIHGGNFHTFHGTFPIAQIKTAYYRYVLQRYCDKVVCTSQMVLEEFNKRFGIERERLTLLYNGIDIDRFAPAGQAVRKAVRARYGVNDGRTVLLAVGRLEPQKGLLDLVEAYARVVEDYPQSEVWIVGGTSRGPGESRSLQYKAALEQEIERHGLASRIRILGEVSDVPAFHAAADFYVHPAHWEGWPLALLEAMAGEKPSIFTDCFGHLADFEQGVHGYCVPAKNPERFADGLRSMLESDLRARKEMGRQGRGLVCEHYSIATVSTRFAELMEAAES